MSQEAASVGSASQVGSGGGVAAADASAASVGGGVAAGNNLGASAVSTGSQPGVAGAADASFSQAAQQGQAQQGQTVRDVLKNYGLDLTNEFQDDHSVLQYLAGAYRHAQQLGQLAQYGQLYLQYADQFQNWLKTQQEQQRREQLLRQQEEQQWWKAPEYDPSWINKIYRDPTTGELRVAPGAPPDLIQKYSAWLEHQRNFLDKFAQDPVNAIRPGIEQVARQVAQELIQQHLGGFQERNQADNFVAQNANWIYLTDEQTGQILRDREGRPLFSPLGERFAAYVRQAESIGLQGVQVQRDYALGMLQRDYLYAMTLAQQQAAQQKAAQQQQVDAAQAAKQQFLANAQQQQSAPARQMGNQAPQQPVLQDGNDLKRAMLQAMQQAGYRIGQPVE